MGTTVCRLGCITRARTPGRKFPHVRRTLRETCTQPPHPLPLPRLGGGNVCAGFAGCVPPQMFLAESERCSVLWGESPQPCSPSCRDVSFFSSLFDKEMQISHRPERLLAVFFLPRVFGHLVWQQIQTRWRLVRRPRPRRGRPTSRCVRAAPTLDFPRLSRSLI